MNERDRFVEDHKQEIERMAFQVYKMMEAHGRPDDPVRNFNMAIGIVFGQYKKTEKGEYERIDR